MRDKSATILLDASCLLNLYASGRLKDILEALPQRFGVAAYVHKVEAIYIWCPNPTGEGEIREEVDLTDLIREGLLFVTNLLDAQETSTFVDLASAMDDGEALTGTIAFHREFALATDDRKARREFEARLPSVGLHSTLEILQEWTEAMSVSRGELRAALLEMQVGASYVPSRSDPIYDWWRGSLKSEED